ncbi:MAG: type II toxin-antitoxin system RelE/ParE family toxin [Bacteroidetes bacterium]|nr:type II toxin-antitoxin system RelE/ParE family toxin [Bacteroidota bacterium]MBS1540254.1 type II toxin-antitoxin system RelE/ParE family toxin [Bacteroidota bacterium]
MPKNPDYFINFLPEAREDVREIVLWYRNEKEGLEDRFLLSLQAAINSIVIHPHHYQITFDMIRTVTLKRFPYRVHYFIEETEVRVLGIIHAKRNPKLIRKRIK